MEKKMQEVKAVAVVADLATDQIISLLDLAEQSDQVWFDGISELVRRSEVTKGEYYKSQATAWLAQNFRKEDDWAIDWLQRAVLESGVVRREALEFRQEHAGTPAVQFLEQQDVTGDWREWEWLPAILKERIEVVELSAGRFGVAPFGSRDRCDRPYWLLIAETEKIPGGDGFFRLREDGRMDIFLRRGSRETGPQGWMWVLVNPNTEPEEMVEAAIDPMDNYGALRGFGVEYKPLFKRIARAYTKVRESIKK